MSSLIFGKFGGLRIDVTWPILKPLIDGTTSLLHYIEGTDEGGNTTVAAFDGNVGYFTTLANTTEDGEFTVAKLTAIAYANESTPKTSDGRSIVLQTRFRGDIDPYFAGCGDDPATSPGRGDGPAFVLSSAVAGDTELVFQFNDWIYISGGDIRWGGGGPGDEATFCMFAPATTVAANAGSGNCNLVPAGGYNVIIPAAGDGSHDVSDADKIPLPAYDSNGVPNGYWNWDGPNEGRGTVSAAPGADGNCNLIDIENILVVWIAKLQLVGDGIKQVRPETKARKIYPHWQFKAKLHNSGSSNLWLAWDLDLARKSTT